MLLNAALHCQLLHLLNLCCLGTLEHTNLAGYIHVCRMLHLISLALAATDVILFLLRYQTIPERKHGCQSWV